VQKVPPKVTAYPLSYALNKLDRAGYKAVLQKTLPPKAQEMETTWRVIRQKSLGNQEIELLISKQSW